MSVNWEKHRRLIILLVILIILIVFLGGKLLFERVDFTPRPKSVIKYVQALTLQNARCFLDVPRSQECTCLGVGCCGASTGFYYDPTTDFCYKITVENSGTPFKSMDECEDTCRTMIYNKIGNKYIKIDKNIYYVPTRAPLEGVDINTFVLSGDFFGKDTNSVYYTSQRIKLANSKSFLELSSDYSKDDKNIFYKSGAVKDADYDSFKVLRDQAGESLSYAKDKNHVYINGAIFSVADVNSFQVLRFPYSKDKNRVYIFKDVVAGQNPINFQ